MSTIQGLCPVLGLKGLRLPTCRQGPERMFKCCADLKHYLSFLCGLAITNHTPSDNAPQTLRKLLAV